MAKTSITDEQRRVPQVSEQAEPGENEYRSYLAAKARFHLAVAEQDDPDGDREERVDALCVEHEGKLQKLMFAACVDTSGLARKLEVFRDEDLINHRLAASFIAALADEARHISITSN